MKDKKYKDCKGFAKALAKYTRNKSDLSIEDICKVSGFDREDVRIRMDSCVENGLVTRRGHKYAINEMDDSIVGYFETSIYETAFSANFHGYTVTPWPGVADALKKLGYVVYSDEEICSSDEYKKHIDSYYLDVYVRVMKAHFNPETDNGYVVIKKEV